MSTGSSVSSAVTFGKLVISVIMPVRNEAQYIERTLHQLLTQDYAAQSFEVIVVDGQSTDCTRSLVEQFIKNHANIRLLDNPRRLSSSARNIGVRHARGELVLLIDGHCELEGGNYFNDLVEAFNSSGAHCIGRPQPLDIVGASMLQRAIAAARSSKLGHHPDSFIYSSQSQFVPAKSVAVAYRREIFDRIGLFDEAFDACEDVEFNHRIDRAGLKCFFAPKLAVHYAPRQTLRALFRQLVRYGRGRVRLQKKHPETFSILPTIPGLFVAGVLLGPFSAFISKALLLIYLGVLVLYAALILGGSLSVATRARELRLLPRLPFVFATIHAGSGIGLLWESLRQARLSVSRSRDERSSSRGLTHGD
jgi:succinoglycan biosynthesis protein ExoA